MLLRKVDVDINQFAAFQAAEHMVSTRNPKELPVILPKGKKPSGALIVKEFEKPEGANSSRDDARLQARPS